MKADDAEVRPSRAGLMIFVIAMLPSLLIKCVIGFIGLLLGADGADVPGYAGFFKATLIGLPIALVVLTALLVARRERTGSFRPKSTGEVLSLGLWVVLAIPLLAEAIAQQVWLALK